MKNDVLSKCQKETLEQKIVVLGQTHYQIVFEFSKTWIKNIYQYRNFLER